MRKNVNQFPAIGQGCERVHMSVGIYHKRDFYFCKKHSYLELNICQGCGELFHTDRRNAKTCSDKCRQRLSRKKRKEKQNEKRYVVINSKKGQFLQEVF